MDMELWRRRAAQRMGAPQELLYTLTSHWLLVATCVGLGVLVMAAKVSTETPVFPGEATLIINTGESLVVDQGQGKSTSREEANSLFQARVALLRSDSTLRRLTHAITARNVLSQDENPNEATYGAFRRFVVRVKKEFAAALDYLKNPDSRDFGQEHLVQKAVAAFRNRSEVIANANTQTVRLIVYGSNRELVAKELEQWVEAYTFRLEELSTETLDLFIASSTRRWRQLEEDARGRVEAFQAKNPDVSKSRKDFLFQETLQLQTRRTELKRQLDKLQTGASDPAPAPEIVTAGPAHTYVEPDANDAWLGVLKKRLQEKETERASILSIYPEGSDHDRIISEAIAHLQTAIEQSSVLEQAAVPTPSVSSQPSRAVTAVPDETDAKLREQLETVELELDRSMLEHRRLDERLEVLAQLENEHRMDRQTRRNYELIRHEQIDRTMSSKFVQAHLIEKPTVSWSPRDAYPYRLILSGSAAGLVVGLALSFAWELLYRKARFRADIETVLVDIPVVAVFPRKTA